MAKPDRLGPATDRLREVGLDEAALWMERKAGPRIAIDERTPEVDGEYLVGLFVADPPHHDLMRIGVWRGDRFTNDDGSIGYRTTHWMPLPGPPARVPLSRQ